jgi:hypothetical protein
VAAKATAPATALPSARRHLAPELVATLPTSFVEGSGEAAETFWIERGTTFRVHGAVFPVPLEQKHDEMLRENPGKYVEDKSRRKEHMFELATYIAGPMQMAYLAMAHVSDGRRSVRVSCSGSYALDRICKEAIASVWFAPDAAARPKDAPTGKRWLEQQQTYVLVPADFLPDPSAQGVGATQGEVRLSFQVGDSTERVSLLDAMRQALPTNWKDIESEMPLRRAVGGGSFIEAIYVKHLGDSYWVISRLVPVSATATALVVCSAPAREFYAQPKRCAALLDTLEVVTPTPLVNARAEGGSVVR